MVRLVLKVLNAKKEQVKWFLFLPFRCQSYETITEKFSAKLYLVVYVGYQAETNSIVSVFQGN